AQCLPLDPRFRGNDDMKTIIPPYICRLPQLPALAGAGQEDVGLEEDRQHQGAVRRLGDVAVALGAPDVIAGGDLALVVLEAAFEDEGLLDLDMLVEGQFGTRLPAEEGGQEPGLLVL